MFTSKQKFKQPDRDAELAVCSDGAGSKRFEQLNGGAEPVACFYAPALTPEVARG